jgi:hypothetical protein
MKKVKLFLNGFREIEFSPILIGAIILGFAGWQNMYPLVYPDTGTYVITGLEGRVPYDRPLLYGLFLKHTSMRATMWMAMYAQAILVSSVIFTFIKSYFLKQNYRIIYFLCLFILVGCTAISIKTSTLIPDVFTPLPILCFFILLHGSLNITLKIWFSFIMVFAIAVHQSHLMILVSALLLSGIVVGMRLGKKIFIQQLLRVKFLIPIVIISFLLTPTINLLYSGRFFLCK